jgi:hypothetical protein
MEMNKKEAATLLANSPKAFVKVFGAKVNTLHVGIGEGVVEETLAKGHSALKKGLKVQWADGRQQWETTMQVFDSSKEGSAQFTWDSSGDKVKHEVFLVTKFPNGDMTKEFVRNSWRLFE